MNQMEELVVMNGREVLQAERLASIRHLGYVRTSLGRTYPGDIQNSILSLGSNLDAMMDRSMELLLQHDIDVRDRVRNLNARLVNEVIIVSDEIGDEEVRKRLKAQNDEAFDLVVVFRQAGIPLTLSQPPEPTVAATAVIPKAQAEALLSAFKDAWEKSPGLFERRQNIAPLLNALLAVPFFGVLFQKPTKELDGRLEAVNKGSVFARDAFLKLEKEFLPAATDAVRIERGAWDRMRFWVSSVEFADERLKRLEGQAMKKPAQVAGLSTIAKVGIAAGGTAVTAYILWLLFG